MRIGVQKGFLKYNFFMIMANKKTGKTGTHSSDDTFPVQCSLNEPGL
jgi:hypothetical protein